MREFEEFGINIFKIPECDSDEDDLYRIKDKEIRVCVHSYAIKGMEVIIWFFWQESIPFAIIGSTTSIDLSGRRIRGREYPWGVVDIQDERYSDFIKLRTFLRYCIKVLSLDCSINTCFILVCICKTWRMPPAIFSTKITVPTIWLNWTIEQSMYHLQKKNYDIIYDKFTFLIRLDGTSMTADRLLQIKQEEIRRMQEQLCLMQEQLRQNSRPVSNAQSMDDLLNE